MATPGDGWSSEKRVAFEEPEETLNTSTNIMLLYRLHNLQTMSNANFTLGVLALLYGACNVVMLVLNFGNHNDDPCGDPDGPRRCGSVVSDPMFHRLEFWAAFCFSMVTAFSIMFTPKAVTHVYENPTVLKLVLMFEIVLSLIPAMLVTINIEVYERASHELEYINELTIGFVDVILLQSLINDGASCTVFPTIALCIAGLNLLIYNSPLENAEKVAHYCEFSFGIVSSFVTFWFCMDNRFEADIEIMDILYGSHRDCVQCNRQFKERVSTRRRSSIVQSIRRTFGGAASLRRRYQGYDAIIDASEAQL